MKKVLIVAVCLALVLTLAFTLGALGKKPDKPPGKPEYVYELTFEKKLDVTGTVEQCGVQGGFISSSSVNEFRPTLTLNLNTFLNPDTLVNYGGEYDGIGLVLSEHKSEITMQFWFFFPDPDTGEKVQLNVYGDGNELVGGEVVWLSSSFIIEFAGDPAEILPTKGKRNPLWEGDVTITVVCKPQG